ncbi:hypothetical protein V1291_004499 [Nitrobacteraceae bacterium AZCC 1564]
MGWTAGAAGEELRRRACEDTLHCKNVVRCAHKPLADESDAATGAALIVDLVHLDICGFDDFPPTFPFAGDVTRKFLGLDGNCNGAELCHLLGRLGALHEVPDFGGELVDDGLRRIRGLV